MEYIHQNAKLNVIRTYKIIPEKKFQEVQNLPLLYELLKEYKYTKIFSLKESDFNSFKIFEESVIFELQETFTLLRNLLHSKDFWLLQLLNFFYIENSVQVANYEMSTFDIERMHKFKFFIPKILKVKNKNIKNLLKTLIDFENIKILLSYTTISEIEKVDNLKFFEGGNIETKIFIKNFSDIETLKKEVEKKYPRLNFNNIEDFHSYIEKEIKQKFFPLKNFYFTIEPLIIYFFEKLFEVRNIKKLFIKLAG